MKTGKGVELINTVVQKTFNGSWWGPDNGDGFRSGPTREERHWIQRHDGSSGGQRSGKRCDTLLTLNTLPLVEPNRGRTFGSHRWRVHILLQDKNIDDDISQEVSWTEDGWKVGVMVGMCPGSKRVPQCKEGRETKSRTSRESDIVGRTEDKRRSREVSRLVHLATTTSKGTPPRRSQECQSSER